MVKPKVYIARNYRSKFDAAGKAKMDCETILQNNGWQNLGFRQTWIANPVLGTIISALSVTWALLRLKKYSELCLQYPFNKFYRYCLWGAKLKRCNIITLVHDVQSLKSKHGFSTKEIDALKQANSLIVHNDVMQNWLREQGVSAQMVSIKAFDYLHESNVKTDEAPPNLEQLRIVFAGKMNPFIYELDTLKKGKCQFHLYGVGYKPENVKNLSDTRLDYQGCFPADQVIDNIKGDFGLVWYGDELNTCEGDSGKYLKYNNPHKLSLYILCDMPIIIWDKAAMASFVTEYGIGITVSSLERLDEKLNQLSLEQIQKMKHNVAKVKTQLQQGEFLLSALAQLEK